MTDLPASGRIQAEPAIKGRTVELRGSSQQVVILQRTGMSHALLEDQTSSKTAGGAVFRLASKLLLKIARKPDCVRPDVGGEICLSLPLAGPNDSPRSAAKLVMEGMDPCRDGGDDLNRSRPALARPHDLDLLLEAPGQDQDLG